MAGRVIRLWHGTTTSRAQAIATEGFRAVPVLDLVIPVAAAHGLAPDELLKAAPGGWLDEDERGQVVCFAMTSDRAEMWAQEAPRPAGRRCAPRGR